MELIPVRAASSGAILSVMAGVCSVEMRRAHPPEATAVHSYKAENIMCRSVGTTQSKERGAAPGPTAGAPPTEYYPSPANAALTFGCARKYWLSFIPAGGASSEMPNWELRCTPIIQKHPVLRV